VSCWKSQPTGATPSLSRFPLSSSLLPLNLSLCFALKAGSFLYNEGNGPLLHAWPARPACLRACCSGSLPLTLRPTCEQPKLQNSPSFHAKTALFSLPRLLAAWSSTYSFVFLLLLFLLAGFSLFPTPCMPHSPSSLHGFAAVLLHIAAHDPLLHSLTHAALSHTRTALSFSLPRFCPAAATLHAAGLGST
jgi:hypothetical protein